MRFVFRADSSVDIGSGHIARCISLAQELKRHGGQVEFYCRYLPGGSVNLVEAAGFKVMRLPSDLPEEFLSKLSTSVDWLVVDHYGLDKSWESAVRGGVAQIMVIEDLANRAHDCDLLLVQNCLEPNRYDTLVPTESRRLLGPKYALLRDEFRRARESLRTRDGRVHRVLIFFGGTDPTNETAKALRAIRTLIDDYPLQVTIILGAQNPHRLELEEEFAQLPNMEFKVQVNNIAEEMAKADLAIGAGGTATWERYCLGLPTLVVSVAENQTAISKELADRGYQYFLGESATVTVDLLKSELIRRIGAPKQNLEMSKRIFELVDGKGTERVASILLKGM